MLRPKIQEMNVVATRPPTIPPKVLAARTLRGKKGNQGNQDVKNLRRAGRRSGASKLNQSHRDDFFRLHNLAKDVIWFASNFQYDHKINFQLFAKSQNAIFKISRNVFSRFVKIEKSRKPSLLFIDFEEYQ